MLTADVFGLVVLASVLLMTLEGLLLTDLSLDDLSSGRYTLTDSLFTAVLPGVRADDMDLTG